MVEWLKIIDKANLILPTCLPTLIIWNILRDARLISVQRAILKLQSDDVTQKLRIIFWKKFLAHSVMDGLNSEKTSDLWRSCFSFSRKRFLNFLNFMKTRQNLRSATLREVWLWKSVKCSKKIESLRLKFWKLTFLWLSNQVIYKFS